MTDRISQLEETIESLRERLCAVEEASAVEGTMLHESEETIAKLKAENAELKSDHTRLRALLDEARGLLADVLTTWHKNEYGEHMGVGVIPNIDTFLSKTEGARG